ncbi:NCS2 family permease [Tenuifilum thalassicum]|uniref:NCS2 family permease n=1 Tax=Tenuifilum thalassicum TaxID=2590900 RepID=A0A7D3XC63_9BACT|nr:NCS2 family permease [Tenuifilum thalassicum]QKG78792.1 NCS2 family permease [Tenuifilum thalassicum]
MKNRIESFFGIVKANSTIRTEILAGITTFMTMAYILAVNPNILSESGMSRDALFTTTALASVIATVVMALWARLPFALAPGMGLNAFFAFTVVKGMGHSWEFALTAVFLEGIIFILLTFFNVREKIIDAIPFSLKHAISAGIGLFIAFIGLQNAGVIVNNDKVLVGLGDMGSAAVLLCFAGVIVSGILLALRVKGALLIGIFLVTLAGIPFGLTHVPESGLFSLPPSIKPIAFKLEFSSILSLDMLIVVFTFLFVDMFDTLGTLVGVASKADMINKDGKLPRVKQALFADAIGTTAGALLGTSTVTTYVESAAGVAEGGRTGLTSLVTAILFLLALFLSPIFLMVPAAATAPALILVGSFMMSPILKINFDDFTESIPAFLTIIMMPLTYSIAEGIAFGMLSYVILKALSGRVKEISLVMWILTLFFLLKFMV